jgi:hypothetical protein
MCLKSIKELNLLLRLRKTKKCKECGVVTNFASGFEIVNTRFTDYGDATNNTIILIFVMIEPISILIKIGRS